MARILPKRFEYLFHFFLLRQAPLMTCIIGIGFKKAKKPASCAAKRCRKAKMPHNSAGEGKLLTLSLQRWSVSELKAL
ncbi:hypothetical protein Q1M64_19395 [Sinorhizobium meliloti]|nr:hypothetical protein Q1M64_19395 [Sinorhizobium meliloti]